MTTFSTSRLTKLARLPGLLAVTSVVALLSGCVVAPIGPRPLVVYRAPPPVYVEPAPVIVVPAPPRYDGYYGYPGYPGYRGYRHWR